MTDGSPTACRAVAHTVLSGVVVTLLAVAAALTWSASRAHEQAREAAEASATAVVDTIVEPLVTPALVAGEPEALRRLERAVSGRLEDGSIARVKLWSADGRVVYSDERRLVGRRFDVGRAVTGATVSEVSTLLAAENVYERAFPRLVEVYVPVRQHGRTELVFEAYFPTEELPGPPGDLVGPVAALSGAGLALLLVLLVPQTLRLTRRLRQEEELRRGLAERVAAVRAEERERLASGMRDGVLQDLAGVGYLLDAVGPQVADEGARDLLGRASDVLRADLAVLRGLAQGEAPAPPTRG